MEKGIGAQESSAASRCFLCRVKESSEEAVYGNIKETGHIPKKRKKS